MTLIQFLVLVVLLIHMVFIDLKMWNEAKRVPQWILSDACYLGMTVLLYILICISYNLPYYQIIYLAMFGSIAWDWIYGYYMDGNVLYPFANWYSGWGFVDEFDRGLFDFLRFAIGIFFLWIK